MSEDKKEKIEEVKDEEIKESVTSETQENTNEEETETKTEQPVVDKPQAKNESKALSKTAKIAIGAAVGAVAAVAAIVIPTGVVLSQNSLEDRDKIFIDYNVDGTNSEQMEIEKDTRISDLKLKPIEGYVFVGWFKDEACTQPYAQDDIITPESTIYAKYNPAIYLVAFPTSEYFTIDEEPRFVNYGDEISFAITYDEAYSESATKVVVKANGKVLPQNEEGRYVVSEIKENTIITVDGVEINKYTATLNIDGQLKTKEVEYGQTIADWIEELGLNEENTVGFFTSEEFTKDNLYSLDEPAPITEDLTLYTKMATLDAFNWVVLSEEYELQLRAILSMLGTQVSSINIASVKTGVTDFVMPLKHNGEYVIFIVREGLDPLGSNPDVDIDSLTPIESAYMSLGVAFIAPYTFAGSANLNTNLNNLENLIFVGDSAFEGCQNMSADFSNMPNLQSIGNSAFEGCQNVNADFSNMLNLKSIGEAAFAMSGVTEVKFTENSTVEVGVNAFNACEKLESVYIYKNVRVGQGCFENCPKLSYIYLDSDNIAQTIKSEDRINVKSKIMFSGSCDEVDGGATLVIGPNVTMLDLDNSFNDGFGHSSTAGYWQGTAAYITKLIFEADSVAETIDISCFSRGGGGPEQLNYLEEIVCDSQRALNALLSNYNIFSEDYGFKLYVNENLDGAENITCNYNGSSQLAVITLQEESDKEGYLLYEITPYGAV